MRLCFFLFFLCSSTILFAQTDSAAATPAVSDTNRVNRQLYEEVQGMRQIVTSLQNMSTRNARETYNNNYSKVLYTSQLINDLYNVVDLIERDKKERIAYNKISQANNPTSNILGFKLVDVINNSVDETIKEQTVPESKAKPIKSIVGNLVLALGKSFPPLQLVSSVVSSVSSMILPEMHLESKNSNGKIKSLSDLRITTSPSSLDTTFIKSFTNRLSPYIAFYLNLNKINLNLEEELDKHSFYYKDMLQRIAQMKKEYGDSTNINLDDITAINSSLNRLMDYNRSGAGGFDYAAYNSKREIRNVSAMLPDLYDYVKEFYDYSNEYNYIVTVNIENNKEQLKAALQLPKSDSGQINALIQEINDQQKGPYGFTSKYKAAIDRVAQEIKNLRYISQ